MRRSRRRDAIPFHPVWDQWNEASSRLITTGAFQCAWRSRADVGALRRRLMDDDPARCAEEFWPATGERIRVCRLGTWPDGELRLTRRE